ncbi:stage III sporulation protein AE [Tepidibacter thalassicus]|uniref:Stage III sporulation protein AE n=1 Tax=Tepidibacter thalassicus DSM 15285 TaxID=1123350 RepID=A0A1M5Q529_9FIRM|nr:stage III sporulation protein AE [Tepidibacter thalassicus]SHH08911.1 stage III sporulation protein AE [Tepidibacter thalassicus DSM 15285]
MRKRVFISLIFMMILMSSLSFAENDETKKDINEYIENQLKSIQIYKLEEFFENEQVLKSVNFKNFVMDVIKGKKNILELIDGEMLKQYFFRELRVNFKIFISILVLAVLSSILKSLDNSFSSGSINKISNYAVFIVIISISFLGFKQALDICKVTIDNMVSFMEIAIPIEIALLVTLGFPVTSAALNPVFLGGIVFINIIFKTFLIITMTLSFSILIVNSISKNIKLKKFFSFIKQINIFTIGFLLTVYLGIISIQGIYVTSFDKFSVKTIKFAVDFIPVVGNFVSDSIEILLSSSHLLKSVLGAASLVILIGICLLPILKIVSIMLVYKISAIIIEPISEDNISSYLNEIGNLMTIILSAVVAVGIMFFITISILASIGNVTKI